VRHHLHPLGYMRYGDDFVLFLPSQSAAAEMQLTATIWLAENLHLQVHVKNNVIFKSSQGLHFLGHVIYPHAAISAQAHMFRKINQTIKAYNIASYQAMQLPRKQARQLPWLLLDQDQTDDD